MITGDLVLQKAPENFIEVVYMIFAVYLKSAEHKLPFTENLSLHSQFSFMVCTYYLDTLFEGATTLLMMPKSHSLSQANMMHQNLNVEDFQWITT